MRVILAAFLAVAVCAEPQRQVEGELIGGVEDCLVDFGTLVESTERVVRLANPAILQPHVSVALLVDADVDRPPVMYSLVGAVPDTVGVGRAADIVVRAEPRGGGSAHATLRIFTDAANVLPRTDDGDAFIDVELAAVGGFFRAPR